ALLTAMLTQSREAYATHVVGPAQEMGVRVSDDYSTRPGTIPLPPTLLMEVARRVSAEQDGTVRLYSDHPFPRRKDRPPLDDFENEALARLREHPDRPYYAFTDYHGRRSLRYATADVMRASCLGCHNQSPESPKKDWQVGDVRGV